MLLDVFAPTKQIERTSPAFITQHARSVSQGTDCSAVHVLCSNPQDLVHHNEIHNLRALQLQNCRPATPAEFNRALASSRTAHRAPQDHTGRNQGKFARDYASAAQRAAYEKFRHSQKQKEPLAGRLDRPMHTSAEITAQPSATAAVMRPRRAVDAHMFETARASRTDTTTAFHSTMLRAMAHSQS